MAVHLHTVGEAGVVGASPSVGGGGDRGGSVAANVTADAGLGLGLRVHVGGEVGGEGGRPVGGAGGVDVDGDVELGEGADVLEPQTSISKKARTNQLTLTVSSQVLPPPDGTANRTANTRSGRQALALGH